MANERHGLGEGQKRGALIGPNPTDRAKNGTKRSVLTEASGRPIAVTIAPANVHDSKILQETLEAVVVEPPNPLRTRQHLCLDKGYDTPGARATAEVFGYRPHIRRIGEEKLDTHGQKRRPARRWMSERCLSWWNGCRGILTRWTKKSENYQAFIELDSALLWYRKLKLR